MNRLGLEPEALAGLDLSDLDLRLVMSHLACSDTPAHPMNPAQLTTFRDMTAALTAALPDAQADVPRSLAATGGTLLGEGYHFDMVRPGIGLYGGLPFAAARPAVRLELPVIQTRMAQVGEAVGYGAAWVARRPTRVATVAAGYADGLIRAMGGRVRLYAEGRVCPSIGRLSMDLLTVDVTDLDEVPARLELLGPHQTVDEAAAAAGTIGYEILTSLGQRYDRVYKGG